MRALQSDDEDGRDGCGAAKRAHVKECENARGASTELKYVRYCFAIVFFFFHFNVSVVGVPACLPNLNDW